MQGRDEEGSSESESTGGGVSIGTPDSPRPHCQGTWYDSSYLSLTAYIQCI